jgi:hypothetical protein
MPIDHGHSLDISLLKKSTLKSRRGAKMRTLVALLSLFLLQAQAEIVPLDLVLDASSEEVHYVRGKKIGCIGEMYLGITILTLSFFSNCQVGWKHQLLSIYPKLECLLRLSLTSITKMMTLGMSLPMTMEGSSHLTMTVRLQPPPLQGEKLQHLLLWTLGEMLH